MGCEEKADEAGPEAAYDVSNTWSAMSPGGHIGSVPCPSVSLLTSKCILGNSRGRFAYSKFLTPNQAPADKQTVIQDEKVYQKSLVPEASED